MHGGDGKAHILEDRRYLALLRALRKSALGNTSEENSLRGRDDLGIPGQVKGRL